MAKYLLLTSRDHRLEFVVLGALEELMFKRLGVEKGLRRDFLFGPLCENRDNRSLDQRTCFDLPCDRSLHPVSHVTNCCD